jgi:hypothetical protein
VPPAGTWPQLHLSYHVLSPTGQMLRFDGERVAMPRVVEPCESVRFLFTFRAPEEAGSYILEWDLVSEAECWFAEAAGRTARCPLLVAQ